MDIQYSISSSYIFLCIALGLGLSALLYSKKYIWPKWVNILLFASRAILVALVAWLLLDPYINQVETKVIDPKVALMIDNSQSMDYKEGQWDKTKEVVSEIAKKLKDKGIEVSNYDLSSNKVDQLDSLSPHNHFSSYEESIKMIPLLENGNNYKSMILISDGIVNRGMLPDYITSTSPIYTIGMGDTSKRKDMILEEVAFNKVVYTGNDFEIITRVKTKGYEKEPYIITIWFLMILSDCH